MNTYDKAHELARAMSDSKEYRDYKDAKEKVYQNEANKKMLMDYKKRQLQMQNIYLSGRLPSGEEWEKFVKLSEPLLASQDISNFLKAEYRVKTMITDIYKILSGALDIDLDFMADQEQKRETADEES